MVTVGFAVGFVAIVIIACLLAVALSRDSMRRHRQNRVNTVAPVLRGGAHVTDKRTEVTGAGGASGAPVSTHYYATFELLDGRRMEFELRGPEFGQLAVGDRGLLTWQGTWIKGFQRELDLR